MNVQIQLKDIQAALVPSFSFFGSVFYMLIAACCYIVKVNAVHGLPSVSSKVLSSFTWYFDIAAWNICQSLKIVYLLL